MHTRSLQPTMYLYVVTHPDTAYCEGAVSWQITMWHTSAAIVEHDKREPRSQSAPTHTLWSKVPGDTHVRCDALSHLGKQCSHPCSLGNIFTRVLTTNLHHKSFVRLA